MAEEQTEKVQVVTPVVRMPVIPVLKQAQPRSMWQRMKDTITPGIDPEKATQAIIDSEALGISPSEAYEYQDQIKDVSKEDIRLKNLQLSTTERVNARWEKGVNHAKQGIIGYQMLFSDDPKLLEALTSLDTPDEPLHKSFVEKAMGATAEMLPIMLQGTKQGVERGLKLGAGAAALTAIAGQAGPQLAAPEEIITVPIAFTSMFGVGMTSGTLENIAKIEAGLGYLEILQLKDSEGNQIDPKIAKTAAAGIGVINGLLEVAQIKTLIKSIPGGEKLLGEAINDTVHQILKSGALKTITKKYLKRYGGFITKETAQELAQESTNIISTELAKQMNNQLKGTDFKPTQKEEIVNRLVETAKQSALAFGAMGIPGHLSKATLETAQGQKFQKEVERVIAEEGGFADFGKEKPKKDIKKHEFEKIEEDEKGYLRNIVKFAKEKEDLETIIEGVQEEFTPKKEKRLTATVETLKEKIKEDKKVASEKLKEEKANLREILKSRINEEKKAKDIKVAEGKISTAIAKMETIEKAEKKIERLESRLVTQKAKTEAVTREKIERMKREGELTQLRQRISDRFRFIEQGTKEGMFGTRTQVKEAQEEIIDMLDASELAPEDKAKFIKKIKNVQTPEQLEKALPEIQERIFKLTEAANVRKSRKDIKKLLKSTKPKKQTGKPKGKFTADVQKVLDKFRKAFNMDTDKANERLAQLDGLRELHGELDLNDSLEYQMLRMAARDDITSEEMRTLHDEIKSIVEEGKIKGALDIFRRESERIRKTELVLDSMTPLPEGLESGGFDKKSFIEKRKQELKGLGKSFVFAWRDMIGRLAWTNPEMEEVLRKEFSVLKNENAYKESTTKFISDLNNAIVESYGIKDSTMAIGKKIIDNNQVVDLGTFKNRVGAPVDWTNKFTKDELIKQYMEMQDPTLQESFELGNNYTPEMIEAINNALTAQDKAFAEAQLQMYREHYEAVNEIYREINAVDLPFNEFYSPIKRTDFKVDVSKGWGEFLEEAQYRQAVTSSSFIERKNSLLPIAKQGSLQALEKHMTDTNYYTAWAHTVREFEAIFKDNEIRLAIEQDFGKNFINHIENHLENFATHNWKRRDSLPIIDMIRRNTTIGVLMLKPALTAKQLVSTFAYLEKLSAKELSAGIYDFFKNPIENYRTLQAESTFIRERGKHMERDIKAATSEDIYHQYRLKNTLANMGMMLVRLGDKGAIVAGSWAMKKAGFSIEEIEEFGSDTQQSADVSRMADIQTGNSLAKLFTMFMSSQRQYLAKEVNAVGSVFRRGGFSPENLAKAARIMAIYHVILPVTFQFVANFGGTDEEDLKEYERAAWIGSLNGLFIFYEMLEAVMSAVMGLKVYEPTIPILQVPRHLIRAITKLKGDDITDEEVFEAVVELSRITKHIGLPADQAITVTKGVGDLMEGKTKEGIGQVLGWSSYAVKDRGKKQGKKRTIK